MTKEKIVSSAREFFEEQGFHVENYTEEGQVVGFELEDWTNAGVDMLVFVDGRDYNLEDENWWKLAFKEYADNFNIDEEIDLHREGKRYREDFSIRRSLEDFEEWEERMYDIVDELFGTKIGSFCKKDIKNEIKQREWKEGKDFEWETLYEFIRNSSQKSLADILDEFENTPAI